MAKKIETKLAFKCDRCGGDKFEQKERIDPSDGTELTNCKTCGYIMLSGGKKIEGKSRLPQQNTDAQIAAYVKTLQEAD